MKAFVILCYSFYEHDCDDDDGFNEEMHRRNVREGEWFESSRGKAKGVLDPEIDSVDKLAAAFRASDVGKATSADGLTTALFDKLRAAIRDGGWTFEQGGFREFEGHHNDTEIFAALRRR